MSYFTDKADAFLRATETLSALDYRNVLIRTLEKVAEDQRDACLWAYYDIPEDAEWDVDMVIKNAELTQAQAKVKPRARRTT